MTREIALHCMKSASELERELCEECPIYGQTGCDHCYEDALQYVIGMLEQEPTTKNDLAVEDCVSRAEVLKLMQDNWHTHNGDWAMQESMDDIRALPSVTPQLSSELEKNSKKLEKNFGELDCISRADAIKAMQEKAKRLTNEDTINGLCGAVAILFDLPSVTPQEPKTGHWTYRRNEKGNWENICSNCGLDSGVGYHYQYCPICGAKMVEPQESEDKE